MGMKHNPETILQLALFFKQNPDVVLLIISEGLGARWLEQQKREYGLNNMQILCYQPVEQMANVLACGDVLIAILEPDAGVFSVPSKVLSYLCAQRPLLISVPCINLAARIVRNNQAGLAVSPGDTKMFINAAEELLKDQILRKTLGDNARSYAERHFNIETITDQFLELI
jgi:glycosyltransferase involved in cell wall biosynthesis